MCSWEKPEAFFRASALVQSCRLRRYGRAAAAMLLLLAACVLASAQTTTISGTVYDPRGVSGLPLPNVLVYASTATTVAAPPPGVQCVTPQEQTPTGAVDYTYTDFQGKFTLHDIPENASYTIVIQAGKWQRQWGGEHVGTSPLTGLILPMPANHTQGNIPMIAIATGEGDRMECVFRDMGVSDAEFTDDNETVNPQGRIHLYEGSGKGFAVFGSGIPGAVIGPSTPSETVLMDGTSTTLLNAYDMVMFPTQDQPGDQAFPEGETNLLNFADKGGRVIADDDSWVWLNPAYGAQFGPVANWSAGALVDVTSAQATVQTNFGDGATLARWLQNVGATVPGTSNQIDLLDELLLDVSTVIPPTQSWVTLNNGAYPGGVTVSGNPVMQMTFDTPVGAPASSQCGRVMFASYISMPGVYQGSDAGELYPRECPSYNNPSYTMSTPEKILEYSLFDLSAPPQPAVPPSITLTTLANPIFTSNAVTFQADMAFYADTPTGIMTFYDGTTAIGTATVSDYAATFTTTKLAAGAHSITAVYSGDADYNGPDTSNAVTENVQDFTFTFAGASSVTTPPASKAVYTLVITPLGGDTLPADVTLSAGGLPQGATATFSPATVPANSGATTVTLTLALAGSSAKHERPRGPFGGGRLPMALGLVLLPFLGRLRKGRKRLARLAVLVVIGAALIAGFTGCDGRFTSPPQYSFTVTAASGSLWHSLTPQLTVQLAPN